ncbi:MAG: hypothetical protein ABI894_18235 [Ilumatobacteraceae bacterium]
MTHPAIDNGGINDAGATTFAPARGLRGDVNSTNSAFGSATNALVAATAEPRLTSGGAVAIRTNVNRVIMLRGGTDFVALAPARLADTRVGQHTIDGLFAGDGPRGTGSTFELAVAGRGGVPQARRPSR